MLSLQFPHEFLPFCVTIMMKCVCFVLCYMLSHSVMSDSLRPQTPLCVGILQARLLEWVAMLFSRGPSQPRDWTQVSCIAGWFFTIWATREAWNVSYYSNMLGLRKNLETRVAVVVRLFNHVLLFATPLTVACLDPFFMGFPRQEDWSGLLFPPPGNCPNSGIKVLSLASADGFFTTDPPGETLNPCRNN